MKIHVICTAPPNIAGNSYATEVYYQLEALRSQGFEPSIHLSPSDAAGQEALLDSLLADDAPLLFEGMQACRLLPEAQLAGRRKIVRLHRIEYVYHRDLARQAGWTRKALLHWLESRRWERTDSILRKADLVCAITKSDQLLLMQRHPDLEVIHLPCFFDTACLEQQNPDAPQPVCDTDPFVLFHGDLGTEENRHVVHYIAKRIAPLCPGTLFVIAGRRPSLSEKELPLNVKLIADPSDTYLDQLIQTARVHLMLTFLHTGIKLKLLHTLVRGQGHIIANRAMLFGHSLGRFCMRADTPEEIAKNINTLITMPFTLEDQEVKRKILLKMKKAGISRLSLFK